MGTNRELFYFLSFNFILFSLFVFLLLFLLIFCFFVLVIYLALSSMLSLICLCGNGFLQCFLLYYLRERLPCIFFFFCESGPHIEDNVVGGYFCLFIFLLSFFVFLMKNKKNKKLRNLKFSLVSLSFHLKKKTRKDFILSSFLPL